MTHNKVVKNCYITIFMALLIKGYAQNKQVTFPPLSSPVTVKGTKAKGKIKIDGILDEKDWRNIKPISNFFRIEPKQGGKYLYTTEVKILFDEKNLYIGAFCKDLLGKKGIRVQDLRRDFNYGENDVFGVQIDAQNTKQFSVSFQTTPYGNQKDLQVFNGKNKDIDWNALWSVKTTRTDNGYYVEFAIPFKSLRYNIPKNKEAIEWGITFFRLARRDYELTVFPKIPQAFGPHRMSYAAKLTGLKVPKPSTNLQVTPYVLYNYDQQKTNYIVDSNNSKAKLGGDIKWAITPNSIIDFTFNTDFAQADVDRAVNNLERFNVFFPERRQFFLENSGIWAGSDNYQIKPFFSRKIGLRGDFNAQPAPIDIGARFTNKNEQRTIAGLYVHQSDTEASAAANFTVFRYLQNYGKENNIGVMLTHRLDEANNTLNLNKNTNTSITIDGLFRPKEELTISYMLSGTKNNSVKNWGYAGNATVSYTTNNMYLGWKSNFVSNHYNPAMGFVYQKNVIQHNPGGYFILRPKKMPWIRRWDPGLFVKYYHDFKNPEKFQQASIYLFPIYIFFKDNSFIEYAITPTWQNIDFDFTPLGIPISKEYYYYTRQFVRFNSDRSKKFSLSGKYEWGKFYNGNRNTLTFGTRYSPIPNVSISGDYEYNALNNLGTNNEDLKTNLYTTGIRLALNPKLQLSGFYQYNDFTKTGRINARFSWEYLPQSFVYLVFNNTESDAFNPIKTQQQFISKITLIKQF
jgi:hypothetical protein